MRRLPLSSYRLTAGAGDLEGNRLNVLPTNFPPGRHVKVAREMKEKIETRGNRENRDLLTCLFISVSSGFSVLIRPKQYVFR